jgi:hypothetical protein
MLHHDPRYFNKARTGFWKHTGYAIIREAINGDDGRNRFNPSELVGMPLPGVSNAYYPPVNRSLSNAANKWGQQFGLDTAFNIIKELADVRRNLFGQ